MGSGGAQLPKGLLDETGKPRPAYAIWIPWDEAGGPQKDISLIVRFVAGDGQVVVGEQTKHVLPGRPLTASPFG